MTRKITTTISEIGSTYDGGWNYDAQNFGCDIYLDEEYDGVVLPMIKEIFDNSGIDVTIFVL